LDMCGRFTLRASPSVIAEQFALFEVPPFTARFNIAPTQAVPVIRMRPTLTPGPSPETGEGRPCLTPGLPADRELVWLRWGLVPSWAKDPKIGSRWINARAETVAEKPAFRSVLRRRCLVAADGFYEWQPAGRTKQPYFIHLRDDHPFAFAGLWDAWKGPDAATLETCTILTTDSNDLIRPIHDRMPVILSDRDYASWLDPAPDFRVFEPLLAPYPSDRMEAYPVGRFVNSTSHDGPPCVERNGGGEQQSLISDL
jgi:putative SOS response-associated peptidase YedK